MAASALILAQSTDRTIAALLLTATVAVIGDGHGRILGVGARRSTSADASPVTTLKIGTPTISLGRQ